MKAITAARRRKELLQVETMAAGEETLDRIIARQDTSQSYQNWTAFSR